MVSHDRTLLATCCEKFVLVAAGQAAVFDGDLEDYKQFLLNAAQTATVSSQAAPAKQNSYHQQKADRQARLAERRPLLKSLASLESQLAQLEQEKQSLQGKLADGDIYNVEHRETLQELLIAQAQNQKQLDSIEAQWLDVQEKLEALPEID